ncbi:DNA primase [Marinimicrobium alkaliphilum]|uniref:DNA primase n=1 Tax=Marinimicrobium alkaliphilum TaxID=2202654 RepID=UPI000DBAA1DD|nr:DNA primase [Marinimicrobium alkaliphilum]
MAGLIPQNFVDDLLDRLDIVEVVDHRVKLKKTGKNYSACCPFHDEKTPSFTVSQDKQFYYCFGCGASGNAIGFLMEYERLSFPDAVDSLARVAGLEVPREERSAAQEQRAEQKKNIYTLLEKADDYYQNQLRHHPSRQKAVDYLKRRGLDGRTAKDYGVGFAPPGWDNLLKALAQTEEDKQLLIDGGMLIHQAEQKKLYDRFRHRIMFPIRDTRGRVIGFGGRVLGDDKPKYLNSPETPVFHKGQELYGLFEARLAYRSLPRLLVVEGYMDVVSLAQFGIRYGVATLGTACGEDHLRRAFRYTQEVVFCFDGDKAGRNAALRALESALPVMEDGRTVKFLFLPDGEDPDTLVRQIGPDKFTHMIELAVPLEDFLFDAVSEDLNIRSMDGRATLSKRAAPMLAKLPKGVFRELMFDSLATRTGLNRRTLQELISASTNRASPPAPETPAPETPAPSEARPSAPPAAPLHTDDPGPGALAPDRPEGAADEPPPDYDGYFEGLPDNPFAPEAEARAPSKYLLRPARKALGLLLAHPALAAELELGDLDEALARDEPELVQLRQLLALLRERPHYRLSHIIGFWQGTYGPDATETLAAIAGHDLLAAASAIARPRPDKAAKAEYDAASALRDCLTGLRRQLSEERRQASLARLKQADFGQLSAEEKKQLVDQALAGKITPEG